MCPSLGRICWGLSYFTSSFVFQVINEKIQIANILLAVWEIIYMKIIVTLMPLNLAIYLLFLSFRRIQKQESSFQKVGGPVKRNVSVFLLMANRPLLQRHAKFNWLLRNFFACYFCSYYSFMVKFKISLACNKLVIFIGTLLHTKSERWCIIRHF